MSQVGTVYGQALYSLAKEEQLMDDVLQELCCLDEAFQAEPDFLRLLSAPNVAVQERCDLLDQSFRGKVQPYVLNFLKLLTEKGFARQFHECVIAFQDLYNEDHNILPVKVITAIELTPEQNQRLADKISQITGKTAKLNCRVDPGRIGGVLLDYDGKRIDGSVATRLDSIRQLLKNTVL